MGPFVRVEVSGIEPVAQNDPAYQASLPISIMSDRILTPASPTTLGRVLIKRKQLLQKVPLCERTILDMEKRGDFPKRFTISHSVVAWDLEEVDTWIASKQNAGAQANAPGKHKSKR
jgi:prophage regulatory protein